MEVVVEERVPVYAAGLGDPGPWIDRLHKNGTVVMAVVGAVRHARKVAESRVDIIVAQGHDAGGHNSPVGTMALIPQVVDAVGPIPVLGAGAITDGARRGGRAHARRRRRLDRLGVPRDRGSRHPGLPEAGDRGQRRRGHGRLALGHREARRA